MDKPFWLVKGSYTLAWCLAERGICNLTRNFSMHNARMCTIGHTMPGGSGRACDINHSMELTGWWIQQTEE